LAAVLPPFSEVPIISSGFIEFWHENNCGKRKIKMVSSFKTKPEPVEQKPQKSQQQILKHTEEAALTQLNRSPVGLMLSAFSAGLDIGFSVLLMSIVLTLFNGVFPEPVVQFLVANMYPIGFIFVVLGR
jgi:hypothetical protein